ncbi:MAG: hypothetical protein IJW18_00635 [Lachnospiraceae bacterium]|nr:hypothetical protein [Lachnospiraceae bacterium]
MIRREDLLALDFYKKAKFTGSFKGMRYRVEAVGEKPDLKLKATVWPEPLAYAATPDEKKISEEFEYSNDGLVSIAEWMNNKYIELGFGA